VDHHTRRQRGRLDLGGARAAIAASSPDEKDSFFDAAATKATGTRRFYDIPAEVQHL
jgi:ring-1,2-phenylacetyl-CoA epoxidase subunit PaaB